MILVTDEQLAKIREAFLDGGVQAIANPDYMKTIRIADNPEIAEAGHIGWNQYMDEFKGNETLVSSVVVSSSTNINGKMMHELYLRAGRETVIGADENDLVFWNFIPEWIDDPVLNDILNPQPKQLGLGSAAGLSAAVLLGGALLGARKKKSKGRRALIKTQKSVVKESAFVHVK